MASVTEAYVFLTYLKVLFLITTYLTCTAHNSPTRPMFSVFTSYNDSLEKTHGLPTNLSWSQLASTLGEDKTTSSCQPVGIYSIQRHGSRFPEQRIITTYQTFFSRIARSRINEEFAYLKDEPRDRFTVEKAECLTDKGYNELLEISARYSGRLFPLFRDPVSIFTQSSFQSTETNRTKESAEAFISGLCKGCRFITSKNDEDKFILVMKDGKIYAEIDWLPILHDPLLLPKISSGICKDLIAIEDHSREFYNFKNSPFVEEVLHHVISRLDYTGDLSMTLDELQSVYEICATEMNLFGASNWCKLFSQSDLRAMEYLYDLQEYWYSSYGYRINYLPYCVLLQDIASHLESSVASGSTSTKKIFKFAHSTTIQGVFALLGLYRPSVIPTADNYPLDGNWEYRGGIISPYAANIVFSVFRCAGRSTLPNAVGDFKVLITHNEQPLKIGPCDSYYCDLTTLTSYLRSKVGSCDLDEICGRRQEPADENLLSLLLR